MYTCAYVRVDFGVEGYVYEYTHTHECECMYVGVSANVHMRNIFAYDKVTTNFC